MRHLPFGLSRCLRGAKQAKHCNIVGHVEPNAKRKPAICHLQLTQQHTRLLDDRKGHEGAHEMHIVCFVEFLFLFLFLFLFSLFFLASDHYMTEMSLHRESWKVSVTFFSSKRICEICLAKVRSLISDDGPRVRFPPYFNLPVESLT